MEIDADFYELAERYLEDLLKESPVSATSLGDHRFDSLLNQVDQYARDQALYTANLYRNELAKFDRTKLSPDNQVDYALLKQALEKKVWQIETLREWEWNPLVYSSLPGDSLYTLMSRDFASTEDRLTSATNRCLEFPRFFRQARNSLEPELVPKIHAETAIEQNQGILSLIDSFLTPELNQISAHLRIDLEKAIAVAKKAINEHQTWLENDLLPKAAGNPRISKRLFHEKFDFELFSSLSPMELRSLAEAEMAKLHEEMYQLSVQISTERVADFTPALNPSSEEKKALIRQCLEYACEGAPTADQVVDAANHSLAITTQFVKEHKLAPLPDAPVEIIVMPEFRRGVSVAYCDAPGPLENGGKTFYAVSPPPKDWTEAQVHSFLREYNFRSLHNLTVHEAMPGHYVQLMRSNENSSRLRSVLASGTFIEGWAVYTESMMMEKGFLPDDLLMRLVVKKWNLRGVTNALLDQLIHLDGIDEKAAMSLMVDDAFQEESEAAGKYRRSLLTSVQLSTYFAGYMEVVDIRAAIEHAEGNAFNLGKFHHRLMSFGSPPPTFVKALLLDLPIPT